MKKLLVLIAVLFACNLSPLMAAMSEAEIAVLAAQVAAVVTEEEAAQLVYDAVKANPDQKNAILVAVKDADPLYSSVATTAADNAMMAATTADEVVSDAYSNPTSHGATGSVSPN